MFWIYCYFRTTWTFSDNKNDIYKTGKTAYCQFVFRYSHIRYYNFPLSSPHDQKMTTIAQNMNSCKHLSFFPGPEKCQRMNKSYHDFFKHYNCFLGDDFPVKELCTLVRKPITYKNIILLGLRSNDWIFLFVCFFVSYMNMLYLS